MSKTVRFIPNPVAVAQLQAGEAMEDTLRERAEEVAEAARAIAPVGPTGDYKRSIEATSDIDRTGKARGTVYANDFKARWIEFGSIHNIPQHILSRAAEAVGLRVFVGGKKVK